MEKATESEFDGDFQIAMSKTLTEVIKVYGELLFRLKKETNEEEFIDMIKDLDTKIKEDKYAKAPMALVNFRYLRIPLIKN